MCSTFSGWLRSAFARCLKVPWRQPMREVSSRIVGQMTLTSISTWITQDTWERWISGGKRGRQAWHHPFFLMPEHHLWSKPTWSSCGCPEMPENVFAMTFNHAFVKMVLWNCRYDFYFRSGLAKYIGEHKNIVVVQHAAMIRYRRSIDFLMRFHLKTKLIWFDERALYFEQRFISKHDGFVRAVAVCKNTFVNSEDMVKVMTEHFNIPLPVCPPYLESFIKSNEESSLALKEEKLQLSWEL